MSDKDKGVWQYLVTALLLIYSQLDGTCSTADTDTVPTGCQGDEREDELDPDDVQTQNKESTEEEGQEHKSGTCSKEEPIKQQPTDSKKAKSTPSAGATKKKKGAGQEDKSGACSKEEPIKQQPTDSKKAKSTPSAGAMPMTKKKKGAEKITFPTTLEGFGYEFISKYMDTCNTYCRVRMV